MEASARSPCGVRGFFIFLEVDSKGGGDETQATYMTTIKNVITTRQLPELMGLYYIYILIPKVYGGSLYY